MQTQYLCYSRYPWLVVRQDGQFDPETDQFHNLFEFLKQGLSIFFSEFQSTQVHLKFYPNIIRQHAGKLNA